MEIKDKRPIKVLSSYDVVVVGGGIAGISAAVSAAREGAKTLILEKGIVFGGLATVGLINWYEPLCDGCGQKMIGGIAEELIRLSIKYSFQDLPNAWEGTDSSREDGRYSTHFSPTIFSMALDEYLRSNNVEILLDCLVTQPIMENGRCRGVLVEAKEGRLFFPAKVVVDATGDASVFAAAGAETVNGKNYQAYYSHMYDRGTISSYQDTGNIGKMRKWVVAGVNLFMEEVTEKQSYSGTSAKEITDFVLDGRRRFFEKIKDQDPNSRDVATMPFMPQFRTIRRIVGEEDFCAEDGKKFDTSIGSCGDFRRPHIGKHYHVPFKAQYNSKFPNLIAAGRIISSPEGDGWEVARVIPVCALTGQAAGIAAAMTLDGNIQDVDIEKLQKKLADSGVLFV